MHRDIEPAYRLCGALLRPRTRVAVRQHQGPTCVCCQPHCDTLRSLTADRKCPFFCPASSFQRAHLLSAYMGLYFLRSSVDITTESPTAVVGSFVASHAKFSQSIAKSRNFLK